MNCDHHSRATKTHVSKRPEVVTTITLSEETGRLLFSRKEGMSRHYTIKFA